MAFLDFFREPEEAQTLRDLAQRRLYRRRSSDWEHATTLLRDAYTREYAALSAATAQTRIHFLEVAETPPALEDFAPLTFASHDSAQVLQQVKQRFDSEWRAHSLREQNRLRELQYARAVQ